MSSLREFTTEFPRNCIFDEEIVASVREHYTNVLIPEYIILFLKIKL